MEVSCTLHFRFPGKTGELAHSGWANRSEMRVGPWEINPSFSGDETWLIPPAHVGDAFYLSIPSGIFRGTVEQVVPDEHPDQPLVIIVTGVWSGAENGLTGGISGVGWWRAVIDPEALVVTSASKDPVSYRAYRAAKGTPLIDERRVSRW